MRERPPAVRRRGMTQLSIDHAISTSTGRVRVCSPGQSAGQVRPGKAYSDEEHLLLTAHCMGRVTVHTVCIACTQSVWHINTFGREGG